MTSFTGSNYLFISTSYQHFFPFQYAPLPVQPPTLYKKLSMVKLNNDDDDDDDIIINYNNNNNNNNNNNKFTF